MRDSATVRGDERHRLDASPAVMGERDAQKHGIGWGGHRLKPATGFGSIMGNFWEEMGGIKAVDGTKTGNKRIAGCVG